MITTMGTKSSRALTGDEGDDDDDVDNRDDDDKKNDGRSQRRFWMIRMTMIKRAATVMATTITRALEAQTENNSSLSCSGSGFPVCFGLQYLLMP